jgi:hypothetical protein
MASWREAHFSVWMGHSRGNDVCGGVKTSRRREEVTNATLVSCEASLSEFKHASNISTLTCVLPPLARLTGHRR